jgi:hypothetical protein
MRKTPGRRDSQTFRSYWRARPVDGKDGCHNVAVMDVLDKGRGM